MNHDWTRFEEVLQCLPAANVDARRSDLVREKCHRAMKRPPLRRTVESVIVGGFCVAYITIGAVLALYYRGLI